MDGLYELIFAPPWPLVVGLVVLAVPLAYLLFRRPGRTRWLALIPVALPSLLMLADVLVETDREQIDRVLRETADYVQHGDWDGLKGLMTADFQGSISGVPVATGADAVISKVRERIEPVGGRAVSLREHRVTLSDGQAVVTAKFTLAFSATFGETVTRWQIGLARQPDGRWRLVRAGLLDMNGQTEFLDYPVGHPIP